MPVPEAVRKTLHPFHQLLTKPKKTDDDKVFIAALVILSTSHDAESEARSFSHLTSEEMWDKLLESYDRIWLHHQ